MRIPVRLDSEAIAEKMATAEVEVKADRDKEMEEGSSAESKVAEGVTVGYWLLVEGLCPFVGLVVVAAVVELTVSASSPTFASRLSIVASRAFLRRTFPAASVSSCISLLP